jgi:hypothetical protein
LSNVLNIKPTVKYLVVYQAICNEYLLALQPDLVVLGKRDIHANLPIGQPSISHFCEYLIHWTSKNLIRATSFDVTLGRRTWFKE